MGDMETCSNCFSSQGIMRKKTNESVPNPTQVHVGDNLHRACRNCMRTPSIRNHVTCNGKYKRIQTSLTSYSSSINIKMLYVTLLLFLIGLPYLDLIPSVHAQEPSLEDSQTEKPPTEIRGDPGEVTLANKDSLTPTPSIVQEDGVETEAPTVVRDEDNTTTVLPPVEEITTKQVGYFIIHTIDRQTDKKRRGSSKQGTITI